METKNKISKWLKENGRTKVWLRDQLGIKQSSTLSRKLRENNFSKLQEEKLSQLGYKN